MLYFIKDDTTLVYSLKACNLYICLDILYWKLSSIKVFFLQLFDRLQNNSNIEENHFRWYIILHEQKFLNLFHFYFYLFHCDFYHILYNFQ